jgi:hypothetical protein
MVITLLTLFIFFTADALLVKHLDLVETNKPDNYSSGLWQKFKWWDSTTIVTLYPYIKKSDNTYKYLWFDKSKQQVYYIDFDM